MNELDAFPKNDGAPSGGRQCRDHLQSQTWRDIALEMLQEVGEPSVDTLRRAVLARRDDDAYFDACTALERGCPVCDARCSRAFSEVIEEAYSESAEQSLEDLDPYDWIEESLKMEAEYTNRKLIKAYPSPARPPRVPTGWIKALESSVSFLTESRTASIRADTPYSKRLETIQMQDGTVLSVSLKTKEQGEAEADVSLPYDLVVTVVVPQEMLDDYRGRRIRLRFTDPAPRGITWKNRQPEISFDRLITQPVHMEFVGSTNLDVSNDEDREVLKNLLGGVEIEYGPAEGAAGADNQP